MSQLDGIVESVQSVRANLSQAGQAALGWQRQFVQTISYIIDQVDGTNQIGIKDCLISIQNAISSVQKMQEALGHAVIAADAWIEKHSDSSASAPISSNVMSFGSGYESEDDLPYSHRR